jgi:23S rRNA (uracil1939-C5)-methyltransferase
MKKGSIVSVKVEKFALGGRGLARVDGVPVFVEDVCAFDEARVRIVKKKRCFAEGVVEDVVHASPDRIAPRCAHFGVCGGCSWQFLSYEKQLDWKSKLVRETMQHIGGFSHEEVDRVFGGILGCGDQWHYRNKMEWSFSVDRDGRFSGGFHFKRMHYDTVNVRECFLQSEVSLKIFVAVREFFAAKHARGEKVVYAQNKTKNRNCDEILNEKTSSGFLQSVFVREGKRTGEYMVILQTSDVSREAFDPDAFVGAMRSFPEIISLVHLVVHNSPGSAKTYEERLLFGKNSYHEQMHVAIPDTTDVLKLDFDINPLAFFQPNTLMAEKIYGQVVQYLCGVFPREELRAMTIYDLYCGTGTIGILLSHFVSRVVGIELNGDAVKSAAENAKYNHRTNVEFFQGDVKKILGERSGPIDILTIDPPRSGIEEKALLLMIETAASAIVYVSCNPATFARDAKLLCSKGYTLASLRAFDQFPQTAHIETVALFKKME